VADVYYTQLSREPEIQAALRAAAGFLRSAVAKALRAKHVPALRFSPDEMAERGRMLEDLIDKAVASDRQTDAGVKPSDGDTS
jgi:ribosome-binding factor A